MVGLKLATLRQYDLKLVWDQSRAEPPELFGRKPHVDALGFCLCAEVFQYLGGTCSHWQGSP